MFITQITNVENILLFSWLERAIGGLETSNNKHGIFLFLLYLAGKSSFPESRTDHFSLLNKLVSFFQGKKKWKYKCAKKFHLSLFRILFLYSVLNPQSYYQAIMI